MSLPESSTVQFTDDLRICRILNGMWQVSGAHGRIDAEAAVQGMIEYLDDGFTTWDLADHYGPAEDLVGEFRRRLSTSRGPEELARIQAFTKWVPRPGPMTLPVVEQNVGISLRRMNVETLDLMQFHWWDYNNPAYLDAMDHMSEMRERGGIRHLALTNFDTEHLRTVVDHGVAIVSNQVQYSLVDMRPEVDMVPYCQASGVQLLTYGTVCGGLLTDRYLDQPEPQRRDLTTASLGKYKQMIDAWGGWGLFQELLHALRTVADKHGVSIANVAVRFILDRPTVAGVIVGARLGVSDNRSDNGRVFEFSLDEEDVERIEAVQAKSRDLYQLIGDCGGEYRR